MPWLSVEQKQLSKAGIEGRTYRWNVLATFPATLRRAELHVVLVRGRRLRLCTCCVEEVLGVTRPVVVLHQSWRVHICFQRQPGGHLARRPTWRSIQSSCVRWQRSKHKDKNQQPKLWKSWSSWRRCCTRHASGPGPGPGSHVPFWPLTKPKIPPNTTYSLFRSRPLAHNCIGGRGLDQATLVKVSSSSKTQEYLTLVSRSSNQSQASKR